MAADRGRRVRGASAAVRADAGGGQEEVAAVRLPAGTPIYFEIIESITTRTAKPKKDAHAGYRPVTVTT